MSDGYLLIAVSATRATIIECVVQHRVEAKDNSVLMANRQQQKQQQQQQQPPHLTHFCKFTMATFHLARDSLGCLRPDQRKTKVLFRYPILSSNRVYTNSHAKA